jgi:hypothetical protein
MRFAATLTTDEAPALFEKFVSLIGPDPWTKRYHMLRQQIQHNPLMAQYVRARHTLELGIGQRLEALAAGGPLPFRADTPVDNMVFSFLGPVVQIHAQLGEGGKKRLAGILRDGLNTDRGLRPFQNEIETATHLVHAGFDVTFWDLERGGGFDFLAERGDVALEVECKSVSGDLGRKVHTRRMLDLAARIRRTMVADDVLGRVSGGRVVRVSVPGRLPAHPSFLDDVAQKVTGAVLGDDVPPQPAYALDVRQFELAKSPFAQSEPVTEDAVRAFVDTLFGEANVHAFAAVRPTQAAIVVVVDSQQRDRVLGKLVRDLKEAAADQFSGTRAGALVVQFLELDAEALLQVARRDSTDPSRASALQIATNVFFNTPARAHVHTVVYRSHGVLMETPLGGVQEQGPTYSFTNPHHPCAVDRRYQLFAHSAP